MGEQPTPPKGTSKYPPDIKDQALTLVNVAELPQQTVARWMGIPLSSIHDWLVTLRGLDPSEIEAFRNRKRTTCDLLWSTLEEAALLRATKLALEEGSASQMQAATVTAGICRDKNTARGDQPRFGGSREGVKLVETTQTAGSQRLLERLNEPTP